ncbi:hypothetical protein IGI86_003292 [Enterococcus sp. AZ188]|uniref:DUF7006 family protein n=1 Tax=Enterococcus sp. AZ188 TaxID=2774678 RepID=UPI003D2F9FEA
MLAETIQNPEDYLSYSKQIIYDAGIREDYPKISTYYEELCLQFETVYNNQQENPFRKWGELLRIDAQIQILLELTGLRQQDWMSEFGMTEEEIIQMIRHDKDSFYRELTGGNLHEKPKWGLIYLGEE